jgi:hypothetical protein
MTIATAWMIRRRFEYLDAVMLIATNEWKAPNPRRGAFVAGNSGFKVEDQVDDADDGQDDFNGNVELADIGMPLLDLGGGF